MQAGFFATDITPAVGMEQPGGYGKAYVRGFHDPLQVRAAVFSDGAERIALVGVDTCVIGQRTVAEARGEIEARCGIPGDHILIGASHTHSGGPLFGFFPDDVADAPEVVRRLVLQHSIVVDPLYHTWTVHQIASAVCEAHRRQEDALLSVGRGHEAGAVFNRRLRMANGRTYTHPGKGNPDIVDWAGPVDPEVGVLAAWRADGTLLGSVVNYACHGTTFGGTVSADWIRYLQSTVQGAYGPSLVTVFLNGACGDITQVNNRSRRESEFGEKYARLVGTRVGAEVLKVLVTADRGPVSGVAARTRIVHCDRRRPTAASLAACAAIVREDPARYPNGTEWTFAKERVVYDFFARRQPAVDVEVQAVQVGAAVYLANPAEYFCQFGLDIKKRSRFPFTFVVELANGAVGYVPTPEALSATGGGYETVLTTYSNLEPGAGQAIADASVELAQELTPGESPPEPLVAKPGSPWGYGVLGPELE